jgi:hypothetical protein
MDITNFVHIQVEKLQEQTKTTKNRETKLSGILFTTSKGFTLQQLKFVAVEM